MDERPAGSPPDRGSPAARRAWRTYRCLPAWVQVVVPVVALAAAGTLRAGSDETRLSSVGPAAPASPKVEPAASAPRQATMAVPGHGDVLAGHLLDAAAALGDVEGCRLYVVSRDRADPDSVWVMEVWESPEAHRRSLELELVRDLITRARPLIAGMGERFELDTVGGKGIGDS